VRDYLLLAVSTLAPAPARKAHNRKLQVSGALLDWYKAYINKTWQTWPKNPSPNLSHDNNSNNNKRALKSVHINSDMILKLHSATLFQAWLTLVGVVCWFWDFVFILNFRILFFKKTWGSSFFFSACLKLYKS